MSWGNPGVPLLPRTLRNCWAAEALPAWVAQELGMAAGSTIVALDGIATHVKASGRVRRYLARIVSSRARRIASLPAVDRHWPTDLRAKDVPWQLRTWNCIRNGRLDTRLPCLESITFGDLFAVRSMGVLTALDFACTLEGVLGPNPVNTAEVELQKSHASIGAGETALEAAAQAQASAVLLDVLQEPWADWVSEKDPRFTEIMRPGSGTITERIEELTSNPETSNAQFEILARTINGIRAILASLELESLEDLLRDYLRHLSKVDGPRLTALLARFQWGGSSSAMKLEDAGAIAGVTRERIRQIQARALKRMPDHPVVMPALDRALGALLRQAPLTVGAAAELLVEEKEARAPFHPASLLAAAVACGRVPSIAIQELFESEMVVALPEQELASETARLAYRQTTIIGLASVPELAASVTTQYRNVSEEQIRHLLKRYGRAEFLREDWFWFPTRPLGFVRTTVRKMLSVTTPLEVGVLREGLKRVYRFRESLNRSRGLIAVAPPREVLAAYFRAHPDFVLSAGDYVRSTRPLDLQEELSPAERLLVTVLQSSPTGVLDRNELLDSCSERGANLTTIGIMLTYSAVVSHLGTNLWTLRGNVVDPAVADAIRSESALRPRDRRVVDYGWTSDGMLWIAYRLPVGFNDRVFPVPAAIARFLTNRKFEAKSGDESACGTIRVYENTNSTGQGSFLRRSGADVGDLLLEKFDLHAGAVVLGIIDDEDLDDLSPEI